MGICEGGCWVRGIGDELDMERDVGRGEGLKRRYCRDLYCYPLYEMASLSVSPNIPTVPRSDADQV